MIVTLSDYMNTWGCCSNGARTFCDKNGISWKDFRDNGIDIEVLKKFDHARIKAVMVTALMRDMEDNRGNT